MSSGKVVRQRFEMDNKLELFERTMVPHLNAAYNLARWLTNRDEAEDLVQEAYLRAFRFFDSYDGRDGKAWLLAVVRNTCLTWLGRAGPLRAVGFDENVHGTGRPRANAEEALAAGARAEALRGCVEALPAEYREAIVMRELEEMPYRQIAEATGTPIGTVMSRLSRGRARLLACMEGKR
jgi:RNA polymerase sigma-70 factor (ECF subfamily)